MRHFFVFIFACYSQMEASSQVFYDNRAASCRSAISDLNSRINGVKNRMDYYPFLTPLFLFDADNFVEQADEDELRQCMKWHELSEADKNIEAEGLLEDYIRNINEDLICKHAQDYLFRYVLDELLDRNLKFSGLWVDEISRTKELIEHYTNDVAICRVVARTPKSKINEFSSSIINSWLESGDVKSR